MGYLDRHLNKNEKVVAKARKSSLIFLRELWFLILTAAAYFLLAKFVPSNPKIAIYVTIGLGAVTLLLFISHLITLSTTEIVVTNQKVSTKTGWVKIDTMDVMLRNIDCVQVKFSFIGQLLGYGTLIIVTDSKVFEFKQIAKPQKFTKRLNRQIQKQFDIKQEQKTITVTFGVTPQQQRLADMYMRGQGQAPSQNNAIVKEI